MKFIKIFLLAMFVIITANGNAALNYDASTNQKTVLQLQLDELDKPFELKALSGVTSLDGGDTLRETKKHLILSRLENNIDVDQNGKVKAFLIGEMTMVKGRYVPVVAKGQTDALIIIVKPNGKYSAFHAVMGEAKAGALPASKKAEQDKLSVDAQVILNELTAAKQKNSPDVAKLEADYNNAIAKLTQFMTENMKYLQKVTYDWKAVGNEIDMNAENAPKWIKNRLKILPLAHAEAQATVDKRKQLKQELAKL